MNLRFVVCLCLSVSVRMESNGGAGSAEIVDTFLDYGFDANAEDDEQLTLLMDVINETSMASFECLKRRNQVVASLLRAGARVNHVDRFGRTALHIFVAKLSKLKTRSPSTEEKNVELYKMLIAAGADVHALDDKEQSVQGMIDRYNLFWLRGESYVPGGVFVSKVVVAILFTQLISL